MVEVLNRFRNQIHGIIHCSGGAQTKILHFIDRLHVIKDDLFELPPLFRIIREESGTDWKEMYKVFNMGHRMELYLEEELAKTMIEIASSYNIDAKIIGRVEKSAAKQVTIRSQFGEFQYT
jgi:phosphoribosylformylglycinamidine cyclo-ligase